jgi:predicted TIM-barrel fold metal-dependent hydrolase
VRLLADEDLLLDVQCRRSARRTGAASRVPVRIVVDHLGVPARAGRPAGGLPRAARSRRDRARGRQAVGCDAQLEAGAAARRLDRYVTALATRFGTDHLVWGSDWPFLRSPWRADYAPQLAQLVRWFPRAADRRRILVDTPERWFGFERSRS